MAEGAIALLGFCLFFAAFVVLFCHPTWQQRRKLWGIALPQHKHQTRPTTVTGQELKKLCVVCGAALFVVAFLGVQTYQTATSHVSLTTSEIYYAYYMKGAEGLSNQEAQAWLQQERQILVALGQKEKQYQRGEISLEEFVAESVSPEALTEQINAFNKVISTFSEVRAKRNARLVYESGWLYLFDVPANGASHIKEALICCLVCVASCAGLFSMERKTGMERVLAATPLGRSATVKAKLRVANGLCGLVAIASCLPRFVVAVRSFGLTGFFSPSYSMEYFSDMPEIPLFFYLFLHVFTRWLALRMVSGVTLWLSHKTQSNFYALLVASAVFALPLLLSVCGLDGAKWMSIYPLFHACAMFARPAEAMAVVCVCGVAGAGIFLCNEALSARFGVE